MGGTLPSGTLVDGACSCHFSDACSCAAALEFMQCVVEACANGCQCEQNYHFMDSCTRMASLCPGAGLTCAEDESACLAPIDIEGRNVFLILWTVGRENLSLAKKK